MKAVPWNPQFFETTRGRIVLLLRPASRTVNELAEALGLTDNAIRAHIGALERDGLVRQSGTRPGVRRPNSAYDLTPEAEQLFPRAYGPLLQMLVAILSERLPSEGMENVLREAGHRLAETHLSALQGQKLPERVNRAVAVLGELGGLARIKESGGHFFIDSDSCPLSAAVAVNPQVCLTVETLLSDLLGAPVRERCERTGIPRCCFEVPV